MTPKRIFHFIIVIVIAYVAALCLIISGRAFPMLFAGLFALPVVFYLARKPYSFILKAMIAVFFFVPVNALNILKAINPMTILGCIVALKLAKKIFVEKKAGYSRWTIIDSLYFLFLLCALVSTFSAKSVLGSLNWIFYSVVTGYIVYKIMSLLDAQEVHRVLRFFVLCAAIEAVYGMFEFFILGKGIVFGYYIGRLTSLLGHPLVNGLVFASSLPLCLVLYFETRQKKFLFGSIVIFSAVILTLSRGSWLALACGLIFMMLLSPMKIRLKFLGLAIMVMVFSFMTPKINQLILNRIETNEESQYSSFNIRLKSIPIAFEIAKQKPFFGVGPFNASRHKEEARATLTIRHTSFENTYLGFLIDLGLVGVAVLALLVIAVFMIVLFRAPPAEFQSAHRVAALTAFFIFLINIATFNFDSYRTFHFIAWFYISLNLAMAGYIGKKASQ